MNDDKPALLSELEKMVTDAQAEQLAAALRELDDLRLTVNDSVRLVTRLTTERDDLRAKLEDELREKAEMAPHYKAIEEQLDDLRAKLEDAEGEKATRFTAPIVCICGSTKFKQTWIAENARLTDFGNIVLAIGLWGHHERTYPAPEHREQLDSLHKRKIDLCDWVWVVDVGGYIGESTRSEIDYANKLGKPVRYLSAEFPNYVEPVDAVLAERDEARRLLATAREELVIAKDAIGKAWLYERDAGTRGHLWNILDNAMSALATLNETKGDA